ncbi:MAG TPA: hypothetical protein VFE24_04105 [Pirellulales bacterium]|nr:hypothetical protein [Pirellulales bacterium]
MQKREKQLAQAVGALGSLVACVLIYKGVTSSFASRTEVLNKSQMQLADKQAKLQVAARQRAELKQLDAQSLPTDRQLARSEYQNWLIKCVEQSGLKEPDVQSQQPTLAAKDGFQKFTFTVSGRGTLENVTKFLYGFYQGNHLQKIRRLALKEADNSKQLTMTVAIEALSLFDADRSDRLNTAPATRLAEKDLSKYKEAIVGRNLFAAYVAPPPVHVVREERPKPTPQPTYVPPPKPEFDQAKFAKITSILASKEGVEAWLLVQTTGKLLKLHQGDSFEVGSVSGQVTRIDYNSMEFTSDGKTRSVPLGGSLRDSTVVEATTSSVE